MKNLQDIVDKLSADKYNFIIRRLVVRGDINEAVEVMLDIATQEELIREIPKDWWQHFKLRWYPCWLKRKFPVKMAWVGAIRKFPEIQVPPLGREYVHLVVVDSDKLVKRLEGEPKE